LNVTFYRLDKRRNSLAVPLPSSGIAANVQINDSNTSILSPVLRIAAKVNPLEPLGMPNLITLNYCYIPDFRRYYFITDWRYGSDNCWTASCEVDVLTSYEYDIKRSPCFIERAEPVEMINHEIADRFYPSSLIFETYYSSVELGGWTNDPEHGGFVIGIITRLNPNYGSVKYYTVSAETMQQLLSNMMETMGGSIEDWEANTDLVTKALKSVINPLQYIVSVKWFPFGVSSTEDPEEIWLGNWDAGVTARPIEGTHNMVYNTVFIPIPAGPELTTEEGMKRPNYSPYRSITVYSKIFGVIEIPTSYFTEQYNQIRIHIATNLISGNCTLLFNPYKSATATSEPVLGEMMMLRQQTLAQSIPITQIATDYIGIAKSAAETTASVASSWLNPVVAAAKGFSGLLDATQIALSPSVNSTAFSVAAYDMDIKFIHCVVTQYLTVDQNPHEWGYPVYKNFPEGLVSTDLHTRTDQYVKCNDFHLITDTLYSENITVTERDLLESYLNGGIYYY